METSCTIEIKASFIAAHFCSSQHQITSLMHQVELSPVSRTTERSPPASLRSSLSLFMSERSFEMDDSFAQFVSLLV